MISKLTLRARFLFAMASMVVILCIAFSVALHQFIELLEDEMLNHTLAREMQEFVEDFRRNPDRVPPSAGGLSGYIIRAPQDIIQLPLELANLSEGLHEDIAIHSKDYYVARKDVGVARLYLLLDTEQVDRLEDNIKTVVAIVGLMALAIALLIATLLARAVLQPVSQLATEVTALDPRRRNMQLRSSYADREIGVIADAFDNYLKRLDAVIEREHAFTEDASHELRTPLAIIASAAQLLSEESQLSLRGQDRIMRIRRACGQMQTLIDALLFLAREEDQPMQSCALDEIVRDVADAVSVMASDKNVGLNVEVQPVVVIAPAGMVVCVVNNLLLNAINFTQQGLIEVKLTAAELIVRDTGIGIAPTELSHIFERRYRGSQSRGLGLGLYLVSRICERLGWQIHADSSQGVGTIFRIQFHRADRSAHEQNTR